MKNLNIYSVLFAVLLPFAIKAQQVALTIPAMTVDPGEEFSVDLQVQDFDDIAGMQFAIKWNPGVLQFKGVGNLANIPDYTVDDNFNVISAGGGKVRMLWYDPSANGVDLADNSTLFTLHFKAVGGLGATTYVEITDDPTPPILPVEITNSSAPLEVVINNGLVTISGTSATKESVTSDFTLFQNNPNPFIEQTYLSFNLKQSEEAVLSIYDQSGRIIFEQNQKYPAGLNRIPVSRDMFQSAGSYFYALKTEHSSAIRQLIVQ